MIAARRAFGLWVLLSFKAHASAKVGWSVKATGEDLRSFHTGITEGNKPFIRRPAESNQLSIRTSQIQQRLFSAQKWVR